MRLVTFNLYNHPWKRQARLSAAAECLRDAQSLYDTLPAERILPTWNGVSVLDHVFVIGAELAGGEVIRPSTKVAPSDHLPVLVELA
jgi:endonuclease/exonuclease/phosphatase family metal-dependent hydrolase